MERRIIEIDESRCNGCGICADACHEGAIQMEAGKAKLVRDDYCDGLGDCLPVCPADAISFTVREAEPYNEAAVLARKAAGMKAPMPEKNEEERPSCLSHWPVQIKLAPVEAPYFENADLLIAADCSAYAYASFHERFIKGRITLVGCPKLDMTDYSEKLGMIMSRNAVKSVTVVRMEVPCCGGLEYAVEKAAAECGRQIPVQTVTVSLEGEII